MRSLDLRKNFIGEGGLREFKSLLKTNKTLVYLDLRHNGIRTDMPLHRKIVIGLKQNYIRFKENQPDCQEFRTKLTELISWINSFHPAARTRSTECIQFSKAVVRRASLGQPKSNRSPFESINKEETTKDTISPRKFQ